MISTRDRDYYAEDMQCVAWLWLSFEPHVLAWTLCTRDQRVLNNDLDAFSTKHAKESTKTIDFIVERDDFLLVDSAKNAATTEM